MKTIEEKNMTVAKAFIMFLKANNAFIGYKRATQWRDNSFKFEHYLKNLKNQPNSEAMMDIKWKGFIFNAFVWGDTVEYKRGDIIYWSVLNNKWLNVLDCIKINDYEISEDISRAILSRSD